MRDLIIEIQEMLEEGYEVDEVVAILQVLARCPQSHLPHTLLLTFPEFLLLSHSLVIT